MFVCVCVCCMHGCGCVSMKNRVSMENRVSIFMKEGVCVLSKKSRVSMFCGRGVFV